MNRPLHPLGWFLLFCAVAFPSPPAFAGEAPAPTPPLTLWYRRSAKRWLESRGLAGPVLWLEAESYESPRGSTAPKFDMATVSGGACVDHDWGGREGHLLRYKLDLASDLSAPHLMLRYARKLSGEAVVSATLDTARAVAEPPSGPDVITPLGEGLFPLPCKTPVALPHSQRKAYVASGGLVQSLLSTPEPGGMGGNIAGHGPWQRVEQTLVNSPVPTVVTRLHWPGVEVVQEVFAVAPAEQGFLMRVTTVNTTGAAQEYELASVVRNARPATIADGLRLVTQGQTLLRVFPAPAVTVSANEPALPGPLGGSPELRQRVKVAAQSSASFDLQFLGDGLSRGAGHRASARGGCLRIQDDPRVPRRDWGPMLAAALGRGGERERLRRHPGQRPGRDQCVAIHRDQSLRRTSSEPRLLARRVALLERRSRPLAFAPWRDPRSLAHPAGAGGSGEFGGLLV